jgi:glycosyltransferase involved in cell wall biosynthesis
MAKHKVIRLATILDFGGVERRFVNVSKLDLNSEKVFVSLSRGGWAEQEIKQNGCRVICLNRAPRILNVMLIFDLVKLFRREKPSVVHCSGAEANAHGLLAAWIARVPLRIGEEIGFPNHNYLYRFLFKKIYKKAHVLIGISQAVCDRIVQLGEASRGKMKVVYNPVESFATPLKESTAQPQLVTVSRLAPVKNLDALIQVTARVNRTTPLHLHVVGDGPEREKLVQLVASLGLTSSVTFHGFNDNPKTVLLKSDIFLLISFSEGLGNSILEALACGLLCIVTNVGGTTEIIEHSINGWLVDPHNEEQIVQQLQAVLRLPEADKERVRQQARKTIREKFSMERHRENLLALYGFYPV